MQTITDFIVRVDNTVKKKKKTVVEENFFCVSHRNNNEHVAEGASSTLYFQGLEHTKTTKQLSAWLGDVIDVLDAYGCKRFSGVVVAKSVREWDMSKPIGKRCVSEKRTKEFALFLEKTKETYRRLTGKHC